MTVPSFYFLAFALVCAVTFNLSSVRWWRQSVLLIANLYFLCSFAAYWQQLLPYAGFLVLGYVGAVQRKAGRDWTVWFFPVAVLTVFLWLKRYTLFPQEMLLPQGYILVGLSYVFFRVMHVVIDGWETMPIGSAGIVSYVNYTLNFTSLVSGPIQRYDDYRRYELDESPRYEIKVWSALERILVGFFKVYIVSTILNSIHGAAVESLFVPQLPFQRLLDGILIICVYPIYLYFNFSGYTDFVIGVARFFRIGLPENFDRPFSSKNFLTFWARWHITLSEWLKNYVYSPLLLGLFRRFPSRTVEPFLAVIAYFFTFFLVGFWHGQTSEFLFYGVLQGGGIASNKLYQVILIGTIGRPRYAVVAKNPVYGACARGFTFTWFAFTLLWFWSSWEQLHRLSDILRTRDCVIALLVVFLAATIVLELLDRLRSTVALLRIDGESILSSRYVRTVWCTAMILFITVATVIVRAPAPQIVYKTF